VNKAEDALKEKHEKVLENQSKESNKDSENSQDKLKKQLERKCQIEKEGVEIRLDNKCKDSSADLEKKLEESHQKDIKEQKGDW